MEQRMSQIPASFMNLIERPLVASLATTMNDGTPQVTPVWFSYADGLFYVNAAAGRIKDRNMRARPYVALMIVDTSSAYRYVAVREPIIDISGSGIGCAHQRIVVALCGEPNRTNDQPTKCGYATPSAQTTSARWGNSSEQRAHPPIPNHSQWPDSLVAALAPPASCDGVGA
jgi:hypothetical protein